MCRLLPALILLAGGCAETGRPTTEPREPDLDYPVGAFSLTERSGRTVTDKELRGSVWVASFVFTRCTGPCPQVTSTVARLQSEFNSVPPEKLKFVTFTVDPKRDDLAALREYADIRGADPKRWLFLTGDEEMIHKLMREQFKQAIERNSGPDVKPGDEFGHGTRLALVDKKGVIRALYDGLPDDSPGGKDRFTIGYARLVERIQQLMSEDE
jgi:cytochrome oxidase Cu insertion factor (SCO1/SenC/PrrC family)